MAVLPVIMAGGSGTRLWPLSRKLYPKQFLPLVGDSSLFQETMSRLNGLDILPPLSICNEEYRFIVAEQIREVGAFSGQGVVNNGGIILEPVGKNTAPAIALAALHAAAKHGDETVLLILASDHQIRHVSLFQQAVKKAEPIAREGKLVTFGIVPSGPETGYGYIRADMSLDASVAFPVQAFIEKPDYDTACAYINAGSYFWNSGMFLLQAGRYLEELGKFRPDILESCKKAYAKTEPDRDFLRVDQEAFEACPSESIDYAVMEKTSDAVVVPLDAGWNDVGSWSALWDVNEKDHNGNAFRGDIFLHDTRDSLVHADYRLVTTVGLRDMVVVETRDAVLVADKNKVQDVKVLVDRLKAEDRDEYRIHRKVYRPWGNYDSIDHGTRFQVKHIIVNPGEKLSVQMHHHRAEHWIVVAGTAKVSIDDKQMLLTENESTYIPIGAVHSLENPGKVALELIEVQSGSYLGEDDIVRLDDRYGRV